MAIIFNQAVRHGTQQFIPGVPLAFEDKDAEKYFVAAGWAETSKEKPLYTYAEGSVEIDRDTVHADTGRKVLEA